MAWDDVMQDILSDLQSAHYVGTQSAYGGRPPRKASVPFHPDVLATTVLGGECLDLIERSGAHATKNRKTACQPDNEIG